MRRHHPHPHCWFGLDFPELLSGHERVQKSFPKLCCADEEEILLGGLSMPPRSLNVKTSQWGTPSSERGCGYPACSPSKMLSERLKILSTRVWEPRPGAHLWAGNHQNEERREKATQNPELGSKQISLQRSVSRGQTV